jgi:hypothetical protein
MNIGREVLAATTSDMWHIIPPLLFILGIALAVIAYTAWDQEDQ